MFKIDLYFNYASCLLILHLYLHTKKILNHIIESSLTRSNHIEPKYFWFSIRSGFKNTGSYTNELRVSSYTYK